MKGTTQVALSAGDKTEALVNFIFNEMSDDLVDQIKLDRITPADGGVAREFITTGAILTFAPALGIPIFRLIERWLETNRQREQTKLICEASKEDKALMRVLADLEKKHSDVMIKYGNFSGLLRGKEKPV